MSKRHFTFGIWRNEMSKRQFTFGIWRMKCLNVNLLLRYLNGILLYIFNYLFTLLYFTLLYLS